MRYGDLLLNENNGYYCIFMGYVHGNQIKVMYPNGTIYIGCELPFKEMK